MHTTYIYICLIIIDIDYSGKDLSLLSAVFFSLIIVAWVSCFIIYSDNVWKIACMNILET